MNAKGCSETTFAAPQLSPLHFARRFLPSRPGRIVAASAVLVCVLIGVGYAARASEPSGIAAVLGTSPGISPRLSVGAPFLRCVEHIPAGGSIARAECPARPTRRRPTTADAGITPGADDPRSIHLLALMDLVAEDPRGIALNRAITALRRVIELSDDPTPARVDLSAALIVRAERTQAPRDLLEAYEIAEQATNREPNNPAALYNRALALDRFGLVEETAEDWKRAIAADPGSAWAGEARRRLLALQSIRAPIPPRDDAPLSNYVRYAAEEPQGARELGMDKLLAEWGAATLRGDHARADDRLRRAETLGTALLRRPGGDASLADMVGAIHAIAADSAATRRLAEAHRAYSRARGFHRQLNYIRAASDFRLAAEGNHTSPALQRWAQLFLAIDHVQLGISTVDQNRFELLSGDSVRYPSLSASALWAAGRMAAHDERWEPALDLSRRAAQLFESAREEKNRGAVLGIAADSHLTLGEDDSAYAALHQSIRLLRYDRASIQLHNVLYSTADAATKDGFPGTSLRLYGEDIRVVTRTGNALLEAEARLERARHLHLPRDRALAEADVEAARAAIRPITEDRARDWFRASLQETEAALALRDGDPLSAARTLDSVAAAFKRIQLPLRVLPAYVGASEALLAAGDADGATSRLEAAIGVLERRRNAIRMEPRRAAVFDAAREAVDRIVLLKTRAGAPREALAYLDRARAALAPVGSSNPRPHGLSQLPDNQRVVVYAQIADTVLAWVIAGNQVSISHTVVDSIDFARTMDELQQRLRRPDDRRSVLPLLSRLHAWLIQPIDRFLGPPETSLVIVADGLVSRIPFAGLYDSTKSRYLIETHPLRFAINLAGGSGHRDPAKHRLLLVADPAFDAQALPLLDRLPNARAEAHAIEAQMPAALKLEGEAATRAAIRSAISSNDMLHFAGHAVFDDQRPERSYLLVAPDFPGGRTTITADEISRMNLSNLRLAILSSCQTSRGGASRASGFSGIAGAFLAAGAPAVIASVLDVEDASSAELFTAFYRSYTAHGDATEALRSAQITLLHSPASALNHPAAWAGFRLVGQ